MRSRILNVLKRYPLGVAEIEIAHEIGCSRKTVNIHLREMIGKTARKEGRLWFSDGDSQTMYKDRRVNWLALAAIYAYVYVNPGCRQVDVACGVGLRPCSLYQRLPTMQDFGFLLYEDRDGLLYPFGIARGDRFVATGW